MSGRLTTAGYRCLPEGRDLEDLFPVPNGSSAMPAKSVERVTDGKIFESAYGASRSMGLSERVVSTAIYRKGRAGGHYWRLVV